MKKLIFLIFALMLTEFNIAYAFEFMNSNTHDMQSIREQQFRYQEYNDYKDLQEQKIKHQKKIEEITTPQQPAVEHLFYNKEKSKFIKDNGQIKIEHL